MRNCRNSLADLQDYFGKIGRDGHRTDFFACLEELERVELKYRRARWKIKIDL